MPAPPDLMAELKLRIEAKRRIDELAREGLEHQKAGRIEEARKCLEQAEEIERQVKALDVGRKRRS